MAITKLVLNGASYDLGSITYNIDTLNELTGPETYDGVEIAEDWAAIQTAAKNGTTSTLNGGAGLRVGDYKTISLTDGTTVVCQVAGIDTYYHTGSSSLVHTLDFISKDCLPDTVAWNSEGTNNGTADVTNPFMASSVYSYLENTIYPTLPSDLQAVITTKNLYAETRYSADGAISASTGQAWIAMPHLWLPTEFEIFGTTILGTAGYSARNAVQYPLFANSWYHRIKGAGNGGSRCGWYTATAFSGNTTNIVSIANTGGYVANASTTATNYRPVLCFSVG